MKKKSAIKKSAESAMVKIIFLFFISMALACTESNPYDTDIANIIKKSGQNSSSRSTLNPKKFVKNKSTEKTP